MGDVRHKTARHSRVPLLNNQSGWLTSRRPRVCPLGFVLREPNLCLLQVADAKALGLSGKQALVGSLPVALLAGDQEPASRLSGSMTVFRLGTGLSRRHSPDEEKREGRD